MNADVRFLRVLGGRARTPVVLAVCDGYRVRWTPRHHWECYCDDPECGHVDAVADMLDDRVLGDGVEL